MKKLLLVLFLSILLVGCNNEATGESEPVNESKTEPKQQEVVENDIESTDDENTTNEVEIDEQVNNFIETFNESSGNVESITEVEEVVSAGEESTQVLYASNEYGIIAIFDDKDNLSRYSVVISKEEPYENLQGDAYEAMLHTGDSLGLGTDLLSSKFEESLTKEQSHVYFENDVTVMFHKQNNDPNWGIVVEFVYL